MNFQQIDRLVELSQKPLLNQKLERLKLPGEERRNYHRFLYYLAKERKPAIALELGIQWGTASAHLAEAGQEFGGLVVGVDPINHRRLRWLKTYNNFIFLHGYSTDESTITTITDLTRKIGLIGLVYQDSSHKYLESISEWDIYSPLLDKNAIWICDDITPAFYNEQYDPPGKGMVQYFNERTGNKKLYINSLHYGNAQGIILV